MIGVLRSPLVHENFKTLFLHRYICLLVVKRGGIETGKASGDFISDAMVRMLRLSPSAHGWKGRDKGNPSILHIRNMR
jgi:hypothetical protein